MKVVAVCTSQKRGERKKDVGQGVLLVNQGLEGDAHAGFAHRQISLLAIESIQKMIAQGVEVGPGDFAENLTVEGIDLVSLPIGTRLRVGAEAIIRVTQIGKECHHHCAIYQQAGDCVMPREGIFAEVLLGGTVRKGDPLKILPAYRFGVITASDQGARGERPDASGPLLKELLKPWGDVIAYDILPDDRETLAEGLRRMADQQKVDLIVTTGGTGFSPRDVTPEATLDVIERSIPGIPEALRRAGMEKTPKAMLSRGVAGLRGKTIMINLPGSPKGVKESTQVLFPVLEHALEIATGCSRDCGGDLRMGI